MGTASLYVIGFALLMYVFAFARAFVLVQLWHWFAAEMRRSNDV